MVTRWILLGSGLLLVVVTTTAGVITGVMGAAQAATPPNSRALADIPEGYLTAYTQWTVAECPGLSWTIPAAIGKVESDHGRSRLPGVTSGANSHGAAGPMQFGVGGKAGDTWAAYGTDGDLPPDGIADVYHPPDAIRSAVIYLCSHGAADPARLEDAIWAYNHSPPYVQQVLAVAVGYHATNPAVPSTAAPKPPRVADPTPPSAAALLASPRLTVTELAAGDLERSATQPGWIDGRVTGLLQRLTQDHTVSVSVLRTGHSTYVKGTNRVSNHTVGRAADITALDGQPVTPGSATARAAVAWLLEQPGPLRPDEVGSPFSEFNQRPGAFSDADHQGHLHIGYSADTS